LGQWPGRAGWVQPSPKKIKYIKNKKIEKIEKYVCARIKII